MKRIRKENGIEKRGGNSRIGKETGEGNEIERREEI